MFQDQFFMRIPKTGSAFYSIFVNLKTKAIIRKQKWSRSHQCNISFTFPFPKEEKKKKAKALDMIGLKMHYITLNLQNFHCPVKLLKVR